MLQCCRVTTHSDLVLRARQKGVEYRVIHNASMFPRYYSSRPDTEVSTERGSNTGLYITLQCFRATTHTDLVLRAGQKGVEYRVIHNA